MSLAFIIPLVCVLLYFILLGFCLCYHDSIKKSCTKKSHRNRVGNGRDSREEDDNVSDDFGGNSDGYDGASFCGSGGGSCGGSGGGSCGGGD